MCAYMIVLPTKVNPRFFKSVLSASDALDVAGSSLSVFHALMICLLLTKDQMYLSKLPHSFWIARKRLALLTAALTLSLLRIMFGFNNNFSIVLSVNRATFAGSKLANALR